MFDDRLQRVADRVYRPISPRQRCLEFADERFKLFGKRITVVGHLGLSSRVGPYFAGPDGH